MQLSIITQPTNSIVPCVVYRSELIYILKTESISVVMYVVIQEMSNDDIGKIHTHELWNYKMMYNMCVIW